MTDMYGDPNKAKDKKNPFVDELRTNEQILWLFVKQGPSLWAQFGATGLVLLLVIGAVGFGLISDKTIKEADRLKIAAGVLGITLVIVVIVLLVRGLYSLFTRSGGPEQAYAITNERLLYRSKKTVSSIPLEHLPSVSLFLGDGTKGTFSFGAFFPMWADVENAIEVKHMIDAAQKQRLQRLAR